MISRRFGERGGVHTLNGFKFDAAQMYVHEFVAPDLPGNFHNHPYEWCWALILNGGYEHEFYTPDAEGKPGPVQRQRFKQGDINFMPHSLWHRIDSFEPGTFSLFFKGPKVTNA